jgi:nucleotide-binding universal stress UspA family protein
MATVGQTAAIVRRTWRWCNSKLLKPLPQEHIFVREGTLARVAISVAQQIEASAVVVSGADTASGADIMTIVAEAKVPVLVSRKAQPSESIVAATDLLNESVPVLRRGVQLSTATDNEITFVHNVEPRPQYFVGTVDRGGFVIELPPEPERVKLKEDRLRKIAAELGSDINTVIANKEDTANAILAVARRNQADLVVVGRHHRTWIERVFGENVAAAVVERAERSVLVVPISA